MSTPPEAEFDLEKLFLPAWAQESPSVNRYAKHTGEDRSERRFDDRPGGGKRGPRRDGPRPGGPRDGRPSGGPRPGGPRREGDRPQRQPGGYGQGPGQPQGRRDDRGDRHGGRPERREPQAPLPEIKVTLSPEEKGVESLSRQIKISGRSFPLFDIAQMILQKPERHQVIFEVKTKPDGQPVQPLFLCAIDDTLWLSEDEAAAHALDKHFSTFYQAEKTPTDPPKGTYTFVAQCGMSGVILGPPNYHDYQNQLRRLHAERFSRMPFDAFKSRVKIVKDEVVVKKWVEDQSVKTEYVCLNVPDALRLPNREEVEKHFRAAHMPNIIKQVPRHTLTGVAGRQLRSPGLQRLVRVAWDDQKRFPLQIATILSQQFAAHALQFFKVNKTVTHVSVARPHYLDLDATPVSGQVKQIVDFINATSKCTRRALLAALAPAPAPSPTPTATSDSPQSPENSAEAAPAPKPPAEAAPSPEQAAIIGDLHWLIHQGHVIEFANGLLETAKRPSPKPPKPAKAVPATESTPAPAQAEAAATPTGEQAAAASVEAAPAKESEVKDPEPVSVAAEATQPAEITPDPAPASPEGSAP